MSGTKKIATVVLAVLLFPFMIIASVFFGE